MVLPLSIKTILENSTTEFKEKGSRFIGQIYHAKTEHEVNTILEKVRKENYNATHHCYAYRFLNNDIKYSDDGEPNGTAGIRILNALQHFDLFDNLIIVIRYYGGTKLGVGPLGKAYYNSANLVIENSKIITLENFTKLSLEYDYDFSSQVHYLLNQFEGKIIDNTFTDKPRIIFFVKADVVNNIENKLTELSSGRYKIDVKEENIFR